MLPEKTFPIFAFLVPFCGQKFISRKKSQKSAKSEMKQGSHFIALSFI
jgi:hypothetical protein